MQFEGFRRPAPGDRHEFLELMRRPSRCRSEHADASPLAWFQMPVQLVHMSHGGLARPDVRGTGWLRVAEDSIIRASTSLLAIALPSPKGTSLSSACL
jgi:hypothetical protein